MNDFDEKDFVNCVITSAVMLKIVYLATVKDNKFWRSAYREILGWISFFKDMTAEEISNLCQRYIEQLENQGVEVPKC